LQPKLCGNGLLHALSLNLVFFFGFVCCALKPKLLIIVSDSFPFTAAAAAADFLSFIFRFYSLFLPLVFFFSWLVFLVPILLSVPLPFSSRLQQQQLCHYIIFFCFQTLALLMP
jgi:hypothetical protein